MGYNPENVFWIKFKQCQHEVEELQLLMKTFRNPNYGVEENNIKKHKHTDDKIQNTFINVDDHEIEGDLTVLGSTITIEGNAKDVEELSDSNKS
jgi:hypothetical protein